MYWCTGSGYEELTGRGHELSVEDLNEACRNSSLMERKAMEAEREATKYKQVEFLEDKVGGRTGAQGDSSAVS
jgi:exoribonuclease R